jgi:hypothetical protein
MDSDSEVGSAITNGCNGIRDTQDIRLIESHSMLGSIKLRKARERTDRYRELVKINGLDTRSRY